MGIVIVSVVLFANFMLGIFFNLSIWYKLTNLTKYGAIITTFGAIITFIINWTFIPAYMMKIKIVNKSKNPIPAYSTKYSAGMDVRANLEKSVILQPLERALVPTGLFLEIPPGYEAQIRPRSGFAIKHGISVLNTPGTIDSDYRGEVGIILINISREEYKINHGERICQIIITKHEKIEWEIVEKLNETSRGAGGFGHTGK